MSLEQFMPQKTAYFVTFVTWDRLELTPEARQVVLDACLFFNGKRYQIFAVVVMPDHVHILIEPYAKNEREDWSIGKILHSIKGYSSKQIPKVMTHIGKLWQDGRHEDIIKNQEHFTRTWEYIKQNPVKAELSVTGEDYPFFWEAL
jgi:REP element-mobilizing transposase RayT